MKKIKRKPAIEVCTGPDCSAGGAAILEMEELALEDGDRFCILKGGCRNLCSMGPNVHHKSTHYSKVNSSGACHEVAHQVGMELPSELIDDGTSRVGAMMLKKANRLRWQILRDVGRSTSTSCATSTKVPGAEKVETWHQGLKQAYQSELSAARMFPNIPTEQGSDRAARRLSRLQQIITKRVEYLKSMEDSTDDEEEMD